MTVHRFSYLAIAALLTWPALAVAAPAVVDCKGTVASDVKSICEDLDRSGDQTQTFIVFLDSESAALSDEAKSGIALIAAYAVKKSATLHIAGHTETKGDANANLALSQKRAQAVADELVVQGVHKARIASIKGLGETAPAIKTPDGVAEPRNNRVVVFAFE